MKKYGAPEMEVVTLSTEAIAGVSMGEMSGAGGRT